jgi:hypothetical protein
LDDGGHATCNGDVKLDGSSFWSFSLVTPGFGEKEFSTTFTSLSSGAHRFSYSYTADGPSGPSSCDDCSIASFTVAPEPDDGSIDPKYVVLAVTYAPPGASSFVTYAGTTMMGTSTSLSNTFTDQVSVSVSIRGGVSIIGTGGSTTGTASTSYTKAMDTSSSVALSKTVTSGTTVRGPSRSADGINHDFDIVWVWLNPKVDVTITSPTSIEWNGYSYDMRDPAGEMDIVPLYVAWLKTPSMIPADVANRLARTWDTSGLGGLTSVDYDIILARDPFATNPSYDPNGTSRFDLEFGQTFTYEPPPQGGQPITQTYSVSYQTTSTFGQGVQDTYQIGFSIDTEFHGGFLGRIQVMVRDSTNFTWVNKWNQLSTQMTGQTASLSITGPAFSDGYTGPTAIQVWKDNVYGTFMFHPVTF